MIGRSQAGPCRFRFSPSPSISLSYQYIFTGIFYQCILYQCILPAYFTSIFYQHIFTGNFYQRIFYQCILPVYFTSIAYQYILPVYIYITSIFYQYLRYPSPCHASSNRMQRLSYINGLLHNEKWFVATRVAAVHRDTVLVALYELHGLVLLYTTASTTQEKKTKNYNTPAGKHWYDSTSWYSFYSWLKKPRKMGTAHMLRKRRVPP